MTLWKTLDDEVQRRSWSKGIHQFSRLIDVYEGGLPPEYAEYFPEKEPSHNVNLIRLAWDDLASSIGTPPELRGTTRNNSDVEQKRIGRLEKIGYAYGQCAEPQSKMFYWQLGWWLNIGRAVAIVKPDYEKQMPVLSIRDPRTAYPSAAKTVGRTITELNDVIFKYEIPRTAAEAMGLKVAAKNTFGGQTGLTTGLHGDTEDKVTVYEMLDRKRWTLCSDGGSVITAEHGLGRVPAHIFQTFSVGKPWGLSQFDDQISLQVAIGRLVSLKLAYAERTVYPVYWAKGHTGMIEVGPLVLNKLEQGGEMGQLAPPTTLQADRDIDLLSGFSRILNRNPEVRQGEIQTQGTYVSAKTLEQLAQSIDNTVSKAWDVISIGMKYLYSVCYQMDETLWPDVEKPLKGYSLRGHKINMDGKHDSYTPSKDIKGRWDIDVDYGFGLGGYAGFLQRLQAKEAGVLPKRAVIEDMPGVSDVDEVLRQIELEKVDEAAGELILAMAQQGALDLVMLGKMRQKMADGRPLAEVAIELQEEMQAQAQAALEATGGLEQAMTVPEGGGAPAAPAPRGLPPLGALGVA